MPPLVQVARSPHRARMRLRRARFGRAGVGLTVGGVATRRLPIPRPKTGHWRSVASPPRSLASQLSTERRRTVALFAQRTWANASRDPVRSHLRLTLSADEPGESMLPTRRTPALAKTKSPLAPPSGLPGRRREQARQGDPCRVSTQADWRCIETRREQRRSRSSRG